VVTKAGLAPLVRFTAVNAYRSAIAAGNQHVAQPHPYDIRHDMIELISTRHATGMRTFETFMNQLLNETVPPKPTLAE
jgi:ribosomal protein S3AE